MQHPQCRIRWRKDSHWKYHLAAHAAVAEASTINLEFKGGAWGNAFVIKIVVKFNSRAGEKYIANNLYQLFLRWGGGGGGTYSRGVRLFKGGAYLKIQSTGGGAYSKGALIWGGGVIQGNTVYSTAFRSVYTYHYYLYRDYLSSKCIDMLLFSILYFILFSTHINIDVNS